MSQRILITGGAGFIGSRLVRALASAHRVWVVDNLHPQIHGTDASSPRFPEGVDFIRGDVRDSECLTRALRAASPSVVYHLAAETGTGQSHDEIARYCDVNVNGTARLLEALRRDAPALERLVLASSRAVYGEGLYHDAAGNRLVPSPRAEAALRRGEFALTSGRGERLQPRPTDEATPPSPCSIYASTKLMQELLVTQAAAGASWRATILRLQNVYGPGQSLKNPYTGVLSIFCSQLLAGRALDIYEDGDIVRDFVFVDDVVAALVRALERDVPHGTVVNIGSGRETTILEAARVLIARLRAPEPSYRVSGKFRPGDIRYALADITRARELLGWSPQIDLQQGLAQLADWAAAQHAGGSPNV